MRRQQWALAHDSRILGISDDGGFQLVPRGDVRAVYFTTRELAAQGVASLRDLGQPDLARDLHPLKLTAEYSKAALRVGKRS